MCLWSLGAGVGSRLNVNYTRPEKYDTCLPASRILTRQKLGNRHFEIMVCLVQIAIDYGGITKARLGSLHGEQ